jgi:hypothetical protein
MSCCSSEGGWNDNRSHADPQDKGESESEHATQAAAAGTGETCSSLTETTATATTSNEGEGDNDNGPQSTGSSTAQEQDVASVIDSRMHKGPQDAKLKLKPPHQEPSAFARIDDSGSKGTASTAAASAAGNAFFQAQTQVHVQAHTALGSTGTGTGTGNSNTDQTQPSFHEEDFAGFVAHMLRKSSAENQQASPIADAMSVSIMTSQQNSSLLSHKRLVLSRDASASAAASASASATGRSSPNSLSGGGRGAPTAISTQDKSTSMVSFYEKTTGGSGGVNVNVNVGHQCSSSGDALLKCTSANSAPAFQPCSQTLAASSNILEASQEMATSRRKQADGDADADVNMSKGHQEGAVSSTGSGTGAADRSSGSESSGSSEPEPDVGHDAGQQQETFPQQLMRVLTVSEQDASTFEAIGWMSHGEAFVIKDPSLLTEQVLPQFLRGVMPASRADKEECTGNDSRAYPSRSKCSSGRRRRRRSTSSSNVPRQIKLSSFLRRLHRWGIKQVTHGPDAGAFCHAFFRRETPEMCLHITRQGAAQGNATALAVGSSRPTLLPPREHQESGADSSSSISSSNRPSASSTLRFEGERKATKQDGSRRRRVPKHIDPANLSRKVPPKKRRALALHEDSSHQLSPPNKVARHQHHDPEGDCKPSAAAAPTGWHGDSHMPQHHDAQGAAGNIKPADGSHGSGASSSSERPMHTLTPLPPPRAPPPPHFSAVLHELQNRLKSQEQQLTQALQMNQTCQSSLRLSAGMAVQYLPGNASDNESGGAASWGGSAPAAAREDSSSGFLAPGADIHNVVAGAVQEGTMRLSQNVNVSINPYSPLVALQAGARGSLALMPTSAAVESLLPQQKLKRTNPSTHNQEACSAGVIVANTGNADAAAPSHEAAISYMHATMQKSLSRPGSFSKSSSSKEQEEQTHRCRAGNLSSRSSSEDLEWVNRAVG